MESSEPHHDLGPRDGDGNTTTQARLAAIESHLRLIETLLNSVGQFNTRLDQIHATLELAIDVLTPGQHAASGLPSTMVNEHSGTTSRFRVIAHLRRENHGARLVSDVSWTDTWSIRLYVTALLRNALRSDLTAAKCQFWCEVWTPDDTGDLIDCARLDPDSGAIEWDSDMEIRQ